VAAPRPDRNVVDLVAELSTRLTYLPFFGLSRQAPSSRRAGLRAIGALCQWSLLLAPEPYFPWPYLLSQLGYPLMFSSFLYPQLHISSRSSHISSLPGAYRFIIMGVSVSNSPPSTAYPPAIAPVQRLLAGDTGPPVDGVRLCRPSVRDALLAAIVGFEGRPPRVGSRCMAPKMLKRGGIPGSSIGTPFAAMGLRQAPCAACPPLSWRTHSPGALSRPS